MWNPFKKKAPEVVDMTPSEKLIIFYFAASDDSLYKLAIDIHRKYIPHLGVRGTPEQDFMAEVDNPVPDLRLREHYREVLLDK